MILNKEVIIKTYKDKQGKYLANIILEDGLDINQWLVDNGHAEPYFP